MMILFKRTLAHKMSQQKSVVLDDFGEVVWREPKIKRAKRKKNFSALLTQLGKALV